MIIQGACHCRNIRFELDWRPDPAVIPARACGCTFCRKHGGVWTSCPTGALTVEVSDPSRRHRYGFGTHTADFHVCMLCGVVPVATSEIAGKVYAVVNVNTLEGVPSDRLVHATSNFDGEDEASRLERRAKGWIPRVQFREGAGR